MKSYRWSKFNGMNPKRVLLLQVFRIKKDTLSRSFVDYNNTYFEGKRKRIYKKSSKSLLVLLFQDTKTKLVFTTTRSDNVENRLRFLKSAGKTFRISRD